MCFLNIDAEARQDNKLRGILSDEFHFSRSILENIPNLNLVDQFALDYLHVVLLGVMKKLLKIWFGKKPIYTKEQKSIVSKALILFDKFLPPEFQRHSRALDNLYSFHGNELRTICCFLEYSRFQKT